MQLVRGFLLLFLPPAAKGCNARIHPYHYAYIVSATDLSGAKAPAVFCFLFFFLAPAVLSFNVYASSLKMSATMKRADNALYSYENGFDLMK